MHAQDRNTEGIYRSTGLYPKYREEIGCEEGSHDHRFGMRYYVHRFAMEAYGWFEFAMAYEGGCLNFEFGN